MTRAVPPKQLQKRFWLTRQKATAEPRAADSVSLSGRAVKIANDLKVNWLRYAIELIIMGGISFTGVEKIHEIGYTYTRDERDSLARENEKQRRDISAANKQVAELKAQIAKPEPKAEIKTPPAGKNSPKLPQPQPSKRLPPIEQAIDEKKDVASKSNVLPEASTSSASTSTSAGDQKGAVFSESCARAKANLTALGQITAVADDTPVRPTESPSSIERRTARGHIAALANAFGDDKVLKEIAEESPLSIYDKNLRRAYVYAKSLFADTCRPEPPKKLSVEELEKQAKARCNSVSRLQKSLKALKDQTEAETILTPKGHLVATFNQLLGEAKKELRDDTLIANMAMAETYYWHAESQKYLLFAIGVLSERLQYFAGTCPAS